MQKKPGYWGLSQGQQVVRDRTVLDQAADMNQADKRMDDVIRQMRYSLTHKIRGGDDLGDDLGESDSWPTPPHPHDPDGLTSQFTAADQNRDGQLSYDEVLDSSRMSSAVLKAFDTNKDSTISRKEFSALDRNGNGFISQGEYLARVRSTTQTNTTNVTSSEVQLLGEVDHEMYIPDSDVELAAVNTTLQVHNDTATSLHFVNAISSTSGKAPLARNSSSNGTNTTAQEDLPEVSMQSAPPPLFGLKQQHTLHTGAMAKIGPQALPDKAPNQQGFDDKEENVHQFLQADAREENSRQQMARAARASVEHEMTLFQDRQHD